MASRGCGQALRILPEMFSTILSLPLNRANLGVYQEPTHPTQIRRKTLLHRYRIRPSSLARLRFTGNLASPAENLAKSLDKGWGVEYCARVLTVLGLNEHPSKAGQRLGSHSIADHFICCGGLSGEAEFLQAPLEIGAFS